MLLSFSTENFLSFKNKVILNFEAGVIKEFPENVIESFYSSKDSRLLKSLALYGPNSSGKSNLLKAFGFMRSLILNSSKESQSHQFINSEPFRLSDETESQASYFEVEFILNGSKYIYGFKTNPKRITEEWLFEINKRKKEIVFLRAANEYVFSKSLKTGDARLRLQVLKEITRENALFLSVLAQFNFDLGKDICDWFLKSTIILDGNNQEIIDYTAGLLLNPEYSQRINEIIQKSDLGFTNVISKIKDIAIKTNRSEQFISAIHSDEIKTYTVQTKHKKFENKKHIDNIYFDLMVNESVGTQKYFGLLGPIIQTLKNGSLLWIDELDSRFHPLLLEIILNLFNSNINNPNGAQLVFTLHNTDPLKKILRRDQMIFFEKDEYGITGFNSLYEKIPSVRNDASFEKEYLSGKYGAIPKINRQMNLFKKDE